MNRGKLLGIGVNDADYTIKVYHEATYVVGKRKRKIKWQCPHYVKWASMLHRCYSKEEHIRLPKYKNCTVCPEWFTFSNFRRWSIEQGMEEQHTKLHLDKDLLHKDNNVYSPEMCCYLEPKINNFLLEADKNRGDYKIGASIRKNGRFKSRCCDPFKDKQEHIADFSSEEEAHHAWKERKHEYACLLADSEYVTNERVAESLRNRYL